jgi:uncharacterized protein
MAAFAKYFIESENIGAYEQIFENVTIIDSHTHVGVDVDGHKMTAASLLKTMKSNDINKSIVFPADDPRAGKTFSFPNERILRAYRYAPDFFIPFFRLNPNYNWKQEFDKRVSQGFRGVKLHPRSQDFQIDSPKAMKLYGQMEKTNLILLIHTGFGVDTAASELAKVAKAFPKLKILVGHGGFADLDNVINALSGLDNVMFEISTMRIFDLLELLNRVPVRNIVFGSDIPYYDQTLALQVLVDAATLARKHPNQIKQMLGENVERWLK